MSFLDLAWARRLDPLAAGVRLVDGRRFAVEAAGDAARSSWGSATPLGCCPTSSSPSGSRCRTGGRPATTRPAGCLGARSRWADLDRDVEPDHLTSIYIAELATPWRPSCCDSPSWSELSARAVPMGPGADPPVARAPPAGGDL